LAPRSLRKRGRGLVDCGASSHGPEGEERRRERSARPGPPACPRAQAVRSSFSRPSNATGFPCWRAVFSALSLGTAGKPWCSSRAGMGGGAVGGRSRPEGTKLCFQVIVYPSELCPGGRRDYARKAPRGSGLRGSGGPWRHGPSPQTGSPAAAQGAPGLPPSFRGPRGEARSVCSASAHFPSSEGAPVEPRSGVWGRCWLVRRLIHPPSHHPPLCCAPDPPAGWSLAFHRAGLPTLEPGRAASKRRRRDRSGMSKPS